jgi:hypothetical protein
MSRSKAQKDADAAKRLLDSATPASASSARAEDEPIVPPAVARTEDHGDDEEEGEEDSVDESIVDAPILGEINSDGEIIAGSDPSAEAGASTHGEESTEAIEVASENGSTADVGFTSGIASSLLAEVAPIPAEEPPAPEAPPIGAVLRCNNFAPGISPDEPFGITGTVGKVLANGKQIAVVLDIPSLGIKWPVDTRFIRGDFWEHDTTPGAYPAPGAEPAFDARFRTTKAKATALAAAPAAKSFKPPRPARRGHVWARCVGDSVGAHGFTVKDPDAKQRTWAKDEIGEIPLPAIEPGFFVKVS